MNFQGHDFDSRHFRTQRRIDGYYPDANKGVFLGRCALLAVLLLLFGALVWPA